MLYPLKFKPILKQRIWGGVKLVSDYRKSAQQVDEKIGETWDISAVENVDSVVESGELEGNTLSELLEVYMDELVGQKVFDKYGFRFPLLFKFIDSTDKLSIQVHPDDKTAEEKHNSFGKTELWYIVEAEPNAKLYLGFKEKITAAECRKLVEEGRLEEKLQSFDVKKGDAFYIPAGMVHSIGKGIVLAEVQQSSDITYRLYDYKRVDADGNERELHLDDALEVIDFDIKPEKINVKKNHNEAVEIKTCSYFKVNLLVIDRPFSEQLIGRDSFSFYVCTEGEAALITSEGKEHLLKGDVVFIPANIAELSIIPTPKAEILEVFVR